MNLYGLYIERFSTAASALCIGVVKDKFRDQVIVNEVHLGADDMHEGTRIDENKGAIDGDFFVERIGLVRVIEDVSHAIASAGAQPDAHADRARIALRQQV